jgi:hypothetical protein
MMQIGKGKIDGPLHAPTAAADVLTGKFRPVTEEDTHTHTRWEEQAERSACGYRVALLL